jgi:hypothetical protein
MENGQSNRPDPIQLTDKIQETSFPNHEKKFLPVIHLDHPDRHNINWGKVFVINKGANNN